MVNFILPFIDGWLIAIAYHLIGTAQLIKYCFFIQSVGGVRNTRSRGGSAAASLLDVGEALKARG